MIETFAVIKASTSGKLTFREFRQYFCEPCFRFRVVFRLLRLLRDAVPCCAQIQYCLIEQFEFRIGGQHLFKTCDGCRILFCLQLTCAKVMTGFVQTRVLRKLRDEGLPFFNRRVVQLLILEANGHGKLPSRLVRFLTLNHPGGGSRNQ